MTNINKAAGVIEDAIADFFALPSDGIPLPLRIANTLADTDLLTDDLPEPDKDSPFPGTSWQVYKEGGGVYTVSSRIGRVQAPGGGGGHSPAEARAIAYALLAAADHAEKEQQQ